MKLICEADGKSWVKTIDQWSRKKYNRLFEITAMPTPTDEAKAEKDEAIRQYLRDVIVDVCLYDLNDKPHQGIDAILAIDSDPFSEYEFDIAVEAFWANAVHNAYAERTKMGNAVRRS